MDWSRYMGKHVTPEEYAANGGSLETIALDLRELWGNPEWSDDCMSPEEIKRVAEELARLL